MPIRQSANIGTPGKPERFLHTSQGDSKAQEIIPLKLGSQLCVLAVFPATEAGNTTRTVVDELNPGMTGRVREGSTARGDVSEL